MSQHITKYKTENGKTRKVTSAAVKQAEKNGAPGSVSGGDNKDVKPGNPVKQGA